MSDGGVKNAFTNSSVCRETQSIIKSGKPEILLFLSLIILSAVSGFARSISISTLARAPSSVAQRNESAGHPLLVVLRGGFLES